MKQYRVTSNGVSYRVEVWRRRWSLFGSFGWFAMWLHDSYRTRSRMQAEQWRDRLEDDERDRVQSFSKEVGRSESGEPPKGGSCGVNPVPPFTREPSR